MNRPGIFSSFTAPVLLLLGLFCAQPQTASAMPAFAREYGVSCNFCHAAYPRLNSFGNQFQNDMNYRLPNWTDHTLKTGDPMLELPKQVPLALRVQAYIQGRDSAAQDPVTGDVEADSSLDFQAPYLIKLLSSAPLSEHISYYFYAIFAEKGGNGEVIVEDAWISHDDLFGSGISMQLGQFQLSDLMFPRETRMTFQDFMVYRSAGVTYDRGILFGAGLGPLDLSLGFANGNGIEQNFTINSPGYKRPDHMFDNDTGKSIFGRVGTELGSASVGLFGLSGSQANATGPAGTETGDRDTNKLAVGLDVSGQIGTKWYWFGQWMWNRWEGFLDPAVDYEWSGGFAGVDYVHNDKWVFSVLLNYTDAGDFANTDTVYEGIDMQTITLSATYFFMRNVKALIEVNGDLLSTKTQDGLYYTGHLENDAYILFGFDAAF